MRPRRHLHASDSWVEMLSDCFLGHIRASTLAMHFILLFFFYTRGIGMPRMEGRRERDICTRLQHSVSWGEDINKNSGTSVNFEPRWCFLTYRSSAPCPRLSVHESWSLFLLRVFTVGYTAGLSPYIYSCLTCSRLCWSFFQSGRLSVLNHLFPDLPEIKA